MKVWHIKEFWINCLILLSNQIRFFWIRGWSLLSDCVLYIGHGIYTVIVGRHWSCSPSFLSAAVQLLSFVILSCLSHKHTQTHTHYSSKMMEAMFDKITLWSKRCFLFFRADSSVQWFIHVGQLHECDIKRHNIRSLCLSLFLASCSHITVIPIAKTYWKCFHSCMYLSCSIHNSLIFINHFFPLPFNSQFGLWAETMFSTDFDIVWVQFNG